MREDRAVSTTLGYVLTLGISAILITGLITAGGNYVDTQRENVVRDELSVIGQQVAADAERADRLVRAADSSSPTVRINQTFSERVTGTSYRISFENSPNNAVVVESVDPEIEVRIRVTTETDLATSTAGGGPIQIRYEGSDLEVRDV